MMQVVVAVRADMPFGRPAAVIQRLQMQEIGRRRLGRLTVKIKGRRRHAHATTPTTLWLKTPINASIRPYRAKIPLWV